MSAPVQSTTPPPQQQQQSGDAQAVANAPQLDKALPPIVDGIVSTSPAPAAASLKRARDEDPASSIDAIVQRDPKRGCDAKKDPVPRNTGLTSTKDPNMFYPESYDTFDPECLVADGDAQNSRVGGGKILFIKYLSKARGVTHPLCIQAPKVFLPAGISEYPGADGKFNVSALCSLGREWKSNATMVAFKALCERVQDAIARLILNKNMGEPYCKDVDSARNSIVPFTVITEKPDPEDASKLIVFPPSFKLVINTAANNRTLLVTRMADADGTVNYGEISYGMVAKGSAMVPMIHFNWIYRKMRTNPKGWSYSIHGSAHQAVVDAPNSTESMGSKSLSIVI
jgi:hypothetical protein